MASSAVVWEIIKNNNAQLVKRHNGTNKVTFSKDSLTGAASYKFSTLANPKAVSVVADKDGKASLVIKKTKGAFPRKPAAGVLATPLNKGKKSAKTIAKLTVGSYYRPDLAKFAVRKYLRLLKVKNAKKVAKEEKNVAKKH